MEHNVMTCNGCESQEFGSVYYDGERFYACCHCEAIDDYRMAPERLEEEPERKPARVELHPIFADIMADFMKRAK